MFMHSMRNNSSNPYFRLNRSYGNYFSCYLMFTKPIPKILSLEFRTSIDLGKTKFYCKRSSFDYIHLILTKPIPEVLGFEFSSGLSKLCRL